MKRLAWFLGCGVVLCCVFFEGFSECTQTTEPLAGAWQDLAAEDAAQAYRAIWQLVQQPTATLKLLQKNLQPGGPPDDAQVQRWLTDLSNSKFAVRDKAFKELEKLGELADPALDKALERKPDLETRRRIELLLTQNRHIVRRPEKLQMLRAVEVLELLATPEAKELLAQLAKGFAHHRLTLEAQAALQRVEQRTPPATWPAANPNPGSAANGDALPFGVRARLGTTRFRHTDFVQHAVFFAQDSRLLASLDHSGTIYWWETSTGKLARRLDRNTRCFAVAPKGTLLAIGQAPDNQASTIVLWDWHTDQERSRLMLPPNVTPLVLRFNADGSQLLASNSDRSLRVWDLQTRKEIKRWQPSDSEFLLVSFSPTANHVVIFDESIAPAGAWYLVDVLQGTKQQLMGLPRDSFNQAFSPDGTCLATTSSDGLRLWEVATGKLCRVQPAGAKGYWSPAFSGDGKVLAAADPGTGISLLDPHSGKYLKTLANSAGFAVGAFSPDGRWLAGVLDTTLRVWNLATGTPVRDGEGHLQPIHRMALSSHMDTLATTSDDGTLRLWDPVTGKQKHLLLDGRAEVRGLAFSPDGKWLASSGRSDGLRLWDVAGGRLLHQLPGHGGDGDIRLVQFSPDSRSLLSWGDDYVLRQFNVKTGKALTECRTQPQGLKLLKDEGDDPQQKRQQREFLGAATFVPQTNQLLLVSFRCKLHFFQTATGEETRVVQTRFKESEALAISASGKHLVMHDEGLGTSVVDTHSGKVLFTVGQPFEFAYQEFSPDGRMVAMAGGNRIILVELATGKIRLSLDELPAPVFTHALSADGRMLVTGLQDTTALVWDLALLAGKQPGNKDKSKTK